MKKTIHHSVFRYGLIAVGLVWAALAVAQERPNILWVTSEDNGHHWIGCYGNDQADTPHIDELAREGVRYRFAYANAPVCAVARFTLMTGRYACGMGTQNMRSRYPIPDRFQTYVSHLRENGYYCVNRAKTDYNYATNDRSHWDACSQQAHWKNRPQGKPFFAIFNSGISHESSLFAKKIRTAREKGLIPRTPRLDPKQAALPPYLPDTAELRQDWVTYTDVITAMDRQIGSWLAELDEAGERENTIVIYFSDHGGVLPRAKRYVYDTGTHVPMIVRYPKKWAHLAPGEAGTTSDRPVSFIDLPPTALSLAGVPVPAEMQGRPFLGVAQREAEPYVFLFGQRFDSRMLRFVRGLTDGRYRYIRNFFPHRQRGILTGYPYGQAGWGSFLALQQAGKTTPTQASFWKTPQPVEELYDTQADPWEVHNLADDPTYRRRLETMRQATFQKMSAIRDTGFVPEAMYNDLSQEGTVFDYVQSPEFPHAAILRLAALAGDRGVTQDQLKAALEHDHPVMRYWGATACTILGTAANSAAEHLARLGEDPCPAVRVAVAEALVASGEPELGCDVLKDILANTQDDQVALAALNVVLAHDLFYLVPEDVWERACTTGSYPQRMRADYRRSEGKTGS